MKKIFVRSPYFIEVDEIDQLEAKVDVYLWNKGTTEPTTPTYSITEKVPSALQTKISLNVSNYAKDFIKPISPTLISVPTEENVNNWCYMRVVSYSDDVEVADETFVCLNGYNSYSVGYNYNNTDAVLPLVNTGIKFYKSSSNNYINAFIETIADDIVWSNGFETNFFNNTAPTLWKLPYFGNSYLDFAPYNLPRVFSLEAEELCEPKYTPISCSFINRFGGWQFLTFFKANSQSVDVSSKDFNLLPNSVDYNVLQGQKQRFNFQGKQKIKCNTGWVDENYSNLIQDLLLSEIVLLDSKPVIVKSQSFDIKTNLKDKNINYEIEFEYNYGLINDVI